MKEKEGLLLTVGELQKQLFDGIREKEEMERKRGEIGKERKEMEVEMGRMDKEREEMRKEKEGLAKDREMMKDKATRETEKLMTDIKEEKKERRETEWISSTQVGDYCFTLYPLFSILNPNPDS
jgi:seryl-tRNA synthetase